MTVIHSLFKQILMYPHIHRKNSSDFTTFKHFCMPFNITTPSQPPETSSREVDDCSIRNRHLTVTHRSTAVECCKYIITQFSLHHRPYK